MPARPAWTRIVAWGGFLLLLVLHLDGWRPQRPVLWLGWLPEELVWRLGWMALATAYLWFFCAHVWRDDAGGDDRSSDAPGSDPPGSDDGGAP